MPPQRRRSQLSLEGRDHGARAPQMGRCRRTLGDEDVLSGEAVALGSSDAARSVDFTPCGGREVEGSRAPPTPSRQGLPRRPLRASPSKGTQRACFVTGSLFFSC